MKYSLKRIAFFVLVMVSLGACVCACAQEVAVDVRALRFVDGVWEDTPIQAVCEVTNAAGQTTVLLANSADRASVPGDQAFTVRVQPPEGCVDAGAATFDAGETHAVLYVYRAEGVLSLRGKREGARYQLTGDRYQTEIVLDATRECTFYGVPVGAYQIKEMQDAGETVQAQVPAYTGDDSQRILVVMDGRARIEASAALDGGTLRVSLTLDGGALPSPKVFISLPGGWRATASDAMTLVRCERSDALCWTGEAMARGDTVTLTASVQTDAPGDVCLYVLDARTLPADDDNPSGYELAGDEREANALADAALDVFSGGVYARYAFALSGGEGVPALAETEVCGFVYEDANASGALDQGEEGEEGLIVCLRTERGLYLSQTDAVGAYRLAHVGEREGVLWLRVPSGYEAACDPVIVSAGARADLAYEKRGQIMLRVLDTAGAPVQNAEVSLYRDALWLAQAATDESGTAWFDGLRAGVYGLMIGDSNALALASGQTELTLDYGGLAQAEWTALRMSTIYGRVTGLEDIANLTLKGGVIYDIPLNTDGEFFMTGVMPGEYAFALTMLSGFVLDEASDRVITLDPGASMELSLNAVRLGALEGRAQAETLSLYQNGALVGDIATQDGAYSVSQLRPGAYELRAAVPANAVISEAWTRSGGIAKQALTVLPGETTVASALEMLLPASISGFVWMDDGDGYYEEGNRFLSGASVALLRVDGKGGETEVERVRTSRDGAFSFIDLDPARYMLSVTLAGSNTFVMRRVDGSCILPVPGRTGTSDVITLSSGEKRRMLVGCSDACAFQMNAFVDENLSGTHTNYEPALRGVQCVIYMVDELKGLSEITRLTTNANGGGRVEWMPSGELVIQVVLPEGYIVGPIGNRISDNHNCVPSLDDSQTGRTEPIKLNPGRVGQVGVGAVQTASLSGMVWVDQNYDGKQQPAETGLAGATVTLTGEDGVRVYTATTSKSGAYAVEHMYPQTYIVSIDLPEGYIRAKGEPRARQIVLEYGAAMRAYNLGASAQSAVNLTAFEDLNVNGARDADEPALAGVTLRVTDADGQALAAVTDENGLARFERLRGGKAGVEASLPEGYCFSAPGENAFAPGTAADTFKIDAAVANGGELNLALGVTRACAIVGDVYLDQSYSGTREPDEMGYEGVTVRAVRSDGVAVLETTTNEEGAFALEGLVPGAYKLSLRFDGAYTATRAGDGNDARRVSAGEALIEDVTVKPGERLAGLTAGIVRSSAIRGLIALTSGGGVPGASVTVAGDESTATLTTDDGGAYAATGLTPGQYSVSVTLPDGYLFAQPETDERSLALGTVTLAMGDDITGGGAEALRAASVSGAVQGTAGGVEGARVTAVSQSRAYEAVTGADGVFSLPNVRPDEYTVTLALPEGMLIAGGDLAARHGGTEVITRAFGSGESLDMNVRAARGASLSGRVWMDADDDGVWDEGEAAWTQASILARCDGVPDITLITDAAGAFDAGLILPGSYTVTPEYPETYVPSLGYPESAALLANEGGSHALSLGVVALGSVSGRVWNLDGSDRPPEGFAITLFDASGAQSAHAEITDGAYAFERLRPGVYTLALTVPEGTLLARPDDLNGRVSVFMSGDELRHEMPVAIGERIAGQDVGVGFSGKLGDTAWVDVNGNGLQDAGEPGLPGLTVILYQHGDEVARATTDAYGHYLLIDLYPGVCTISLTVPDGFITTTRRADIPMISSVLPEGLEGVLTLEDVVVPSAATNRDCDLGFALKARGRYPDGFSTPAPINWETGEH